MDNEESRSKILLLLKDIMYDLDFQGKEIQKLKKSINENANTIKQINEDLIDLRLKINIEPKEIRELLEKDTKSH